MVYVTVTNHLVITNLERVVKADHDIERAFFAKMSRKGGLTDWLRYFPTTVLTVQHVQRFVHVWNPSFIDLMTVGEQTMCPVCEVKATRSCIILVVFIRSNGGKRTPILIFLDVRGVRRVHSFAYPECCARLVTVLGAPGSSLNPQVLVDGDLGTPA
eukprot:Cvel_16462.t1-p1 / transcript=Cvel_16462.t1 / gene=Cvel_16462 / organism=Chromera_velia_CCMP2878 / gene_product=hypothetical protein / transcript_product=hypothetical protein / location=Cvel_scaffold1269:1648-12771(-) / protein_length=156 / sequence_SO=supercontig / SO=protein_coding / is_pseudo=false